MAKQIQYLDLNGLKTLYGVVDGKITSAVSGVKTELLGDAAEDYNTLGKLEDKIQAEVTRATKAETDLDGRLDALESGGNSVEAQINAAVDGLKNGASAGYDTLKGLEDNIKNEVTRATGAETELSNKIDAMDLTDKAVDGEFITTVSQLDGKVTIARGKVASDKVTAVAVGAGTDTVAIEGETVDAQIKSLGKTLKTVEGNAAKYKVVKLTDEQVTALGDANVKEAYQVVSYVGADAEGTDYTKVGDVIKIYKDGNLKSATLGDNQKLILTYTKADGSDATVEVDFAAIAFNAEFQNGLHVADNGEISVQVDTASERFLTVGADGVKLAGVQEAIDTAKAAATTKVKKDTAATHITVTAGAPAEDGSVTYTIGETNIASADALTDEVSRAKAAEDKIEASVGLATDGSFTVPADKNYINGATTVMDAVVKLDVQAKANADKIAGMSVDEVNQTVTIDSKGLQFVALTAEEIQDAANK